MDIPAETCEGGLGTARPTTIDTASRYITADKPEVTAIYTSQEVGFSTDNTQTAPPHTDPIPPIPHTGSQPGLSSADRSATSSDISSAETSMPTLSYYGDVPIAGSAAHARASIGDTAFMALSASERDAPASVGEGVVDIPPPRVDPAPLVTEQYRLSELLQDILAWRLASAHAQPRQRRIASPMYTQHWGIFHARPRDESSELVVHTSDGLELVSRLPSGPNAEHRQLQIDIKDSPVRGATGHVAH